MCKVIQQIDWKRPTARGRFTPRGATQNQLRQVLPALGRKILRVHPGEEITMQRILAMFVLWAMIGMAGAILLPLIMGFASK